MENTKPNIAIYDNDDEEFEDAIDDFPFYDCEEFLSEPIESNIGVSISFLNTNPPPEDNPATLRRRRPLSHQNSSGGNSLESTKLSSSVSLEKYLTSRERKNRRSLKIKEYEKKLENENSDTVELINSSEIAKDVICDESSTLTDANENNNVRDELDSRENNGANSSFLLSLAGIMIKIIIFQIDLLVKSCMFPLRSVYYFYMFVVDPFGLMKYSRRYLIQKMKRIWSLVFGNLSPVVYGWLKEHKAIWKLGLKCSWGLLWSGYVCVVLVALLVSAFVIGGMLIRGVVEEPVRMTRILNFDYTEKSPVAFVPIIAYPELSHDTDIFEKSEIGKGSRLRVIPPNHKLQVTLSLTLPESDYNQNLGIFQVKVDFLANDGKTLASSRRPCMLHFKSQPIRLLLTFLKIVPLLSGYTSETQNLKITFKGFMEGAVPTACLRVIIEQRAEFLKRAGIPEIYDASLTLESELPLLKKVLWFWRKTLFVWISLTIFTMELVFGLLFCKPFIIPKIKLRESTSRGASQDDRPSQS